MNIAICIDTLSDGGAEIVMNTLATTFKKLNHNVFFFILKETKDQHLRDKFNSFYPLIESKKKYNILNIKKTSLIYKDYFEKVERQYGKFDLILSSLDKTNSILSYFENKAIYFIIHSSIKEDLKKSLKISPIQYIKKLFLYSKLNNKNLITVSEGIKKEILKANFIKPKNIKKIYNPLNFEEIKDNSALQNNNIPSTPYLIHIGRVVRQKRHDILFKSLKLMKNNLKLVLLCKNITKAKKLALKYGVIDKIIFLGYQKNPYPWIKNAKLLILSSDFEGFGLVILEALSLNTQVVSTDCHYGPNEILTGKLAQNLVERRNPLSLAKKVDDALHNNININQDELIKKFSSDYIANQYIELTKN